jgi:hypothetical protein
LKPVPSIDKEFPKHLPAMKAHFAMIETDYAAITIANLVDQVGREDIIGSLYPKLLENMGNPKIK